METPARELDDARVEAAIAEILMAENVDEQARPNRVVADRPEFPELLPDDAPTSPEHRGVAAVLRQKWADFSGAA